LNSEIMSTFVPDRIEGGIGQAKAAKEVSIIGNANFATPD